MDIVAKMLKLSEKNHPKIHMSPKNGPFQKEHVLPTVIFQGLFQLVFGAPTTNRTTPLRKNIHQTTYKPKPFECLKKKAGRDTKIHVIPHRKYCDLWFTSSVTIPPTWRIIIIPPSKYLVTLTYMPWSSAI